VAPFEATPERREVRLKLDGRIAPAGLIKDLGSVLKQFPGDAPVYVEVITSYGPKLFEFGDSHRVSPEADFFAEVKHLLGAAAVR
jgi:hypothetical protein